MKNYTPVFVWAIVWLAIVILGIALAPEKTGFDERPWATLLELLVIPYAIAAALFLIIEAGKKLLNK